MSRVARRSPCCAPHELGGGEPFSGCRFVEPRLVAILERYHGALREITRCRTGPPRASRRRDGWAYASAAAISTSFVSVFTFRLVASLTKGTFSFERPIPFG